jgi:hypothetical protein
VETGKAIVGSENYASVGGSGATGTIARRLMGFEKFVNAIALKCCSQNLELVQLLASEIAVGVARVATTHKVPGEGRFSGTRIRL